MQLSTVVILLAFISVCWARATLFITGGKCLPRRDDTNSGVKNFRFGDFSLFGKSYSQFVVHSNGYVSVTNDGSTGVYNSKDIVDLTSLKNGPMIAAFWGDVDIRAGGKIFYKEAIEAGDLTMATLLINERNERNNEPSDFEAASLMVATWQNVGYYKRRSDKRNTFQVVLVTGTELSNGPQSYIIFLYKTIGWTTTDSATDGSLPAQVGFTAGDGSSDDTQYLPGFLNGTVNNNIRVLRSRLGRLPQATNCLMNGVYVCRSDMASCDCSTFPMNLPTPPPTDEVVTRSQARADALARFSPHPKQTQLYEEDVEAMEMELDSISNDPSEQDNEPRDQVSKAEVYTEYNEDKNTFETDR